MRTRGTREVLVAPVSEQSFEWATKAGNYTRPGFRDFADVEYIAFYRVRPISAITHVCKVIGIERKGSFKVYRLAAPEVLPNPIPKGKKSGLLNCQYTTLERLRFARSLSELA
jgi:hypothetical protein